MTDPRRPPAPSVVISDFASVKPSPPIPQELACEFLAIAIAKTKCFEKSITEQNQVDEQLQKARARVSQYGISSEYIKQRYMVLAASGYADKISIGQKLAEKGRFLQLALKSPLFMEILEEHRNPQGLDLRERMVLYGKFAEKCIREMFKGVETPPDDIIHVTCSGYLSPSPVEKFLSEKGWLSTTSTNSYHMGCYGSLPALRMAHGFLSSAQFGITPAKKRVDVVHTEVLSAHSKIMDDAPEQIVAMTLFGDGFVKYSVYPEVEFRKAGKKGLKLLAIREHLIENSLEDMTWHLGPHNFDMTLSLRVPYSIRDSVKPYIENMFSHLGLDFEEEKQRDNIVYAIHPGGPLIVKKVCEKLGLTEGDVRVSSKVFYENGNMSSATIPYVLREIVHDDSIPPGKKVVSMAFGPGLTIAGMVLEKVSL